MLGQWPLAKYNYEFKGEGFAAASATDIAVIVSKNLDSKNSCFNKII
jgi:hypothetical protein